MMKLQLVAATFLMLMPIPSLADEFRHIGDFILRSKLKVTNDEVTPISIKPLRLSAFTDGVTVRVSAEGEVESATSFEIYRSDGIGRQSSPGGALEVVPGVQAISEKSGVFRQLRLTRDTMTITIFPGVSNQTIITHAVVAAPAKATVVELPEGFPEDPEDLHAE